MVDDSDEFDSGMSTCCPCSDEESDMSYSTSFPSTSTAGSWQTAARRKKMPKAKSRFVKMQEISNIMENLEH